MRDVAERAGVSVSTVSLVLNGAADRIGDETRDRVLAVADELGYRPNLIASGLRRSRTATLGLVSDRITISPYGSALIAGAQEAALARDHILLVVDTGGSPDQARTAMHSLLDRQVDGLIVGASYHRLMAVPATPADVPVVLLDAFEEPLRHAAVVPDDEQGGYDATTVLLDAGHELIGHVTMPEDVVAARLRLAGYRRALRDRGIQPVDDLVAITEDSLEPRIAQAVVDGLLDVRPDITGLFCFNDRVAAGAYKALRRRGRTVPEDVSVVGFDNQKHVVTALDPELTTVQLPHAEMGAWAVNRLLDELAAERALEPHLRREPCWVVRRSSVVVVRR